MPSIQETRKRVEKKKYKDHFKSCLPFYIYWEILEPYKNGLSFRVVSGKGSSINYLIFHAHYSNGVTFVISVKQEHNAFLPFMFVLEINSSNNLYMILFTISIRYALFHG